MLIIITGEVLDKMLSGITHQKNAIKNNCAPDHVVILPFTVTSLNSMQCAGTTFSLHPDPDTCFTLHMLRSIH